MYQKLPNSKFVVMDFTPKRKPRITLSTSGPAPEPSVEYDSSATLASMPNAAVVSALVTYTIDDSLFGIGNTFASTSQSTSGLPYSNMYGTKLFSAMNVGGINYEDVTFFMLVG